MKVDNNFCRQTAPLVVCYMADVAKTTNKETPVRLRFHPQAVGDNRKLAAHLSAEEALLLGEQLISAARRALFEG